MKILFSLLGLLILGVIFFDVSLTRETKKIIVIKKNGGPILHHYVGEVASTTPSGELFSDKEYKAIVKKGITSILKKQLIWMSQNGGKYVIYYPLHLGNGVAIYHTLDSHKSDDVMFSSMKTSYKNGKIQFGACPTGIAVGEIKEDRMSALFGGGPLIFSTKDLK